VAALLAARGIAVRAANRSGAVRFDWYDPDTHAGALAGAWFMQNVIGGHAHAISIRATSAIATSAGPGRAGFVDAGDIAQVAVEALLRPVPVNTDLILTGPESLSYDDVAAILTETSGHAITHKRLDPAGQPAYYQISACPRPPRDSWSAWTGSSRPARRTGRRTRWRASPVRSPARSVTSRPRSSAREREGARRCRSQPPGLAATRKGM
jgi:nucleoside-diphosphate-sugar epimerase